ncbi:queuosine precursor transporter [Flavobacterium sp. CBA20B-1]|uniref:queuosine precursor transporter n=1 Tax=unclassified Flavobacterium TaxID=196869 RepID=UPI002225B575|nr:MULTISPECIES: queuosine precursor transporter [unclassified Flavobacterium]WCM41531.1 queuosine precursor transporter [Flavobacterium sp. CBA20B-1]
MKLTKKQIVFILLGGVFITNAIVAELIGGKLINVGPFILSVGILPWPIVFVVTDLINEYFGKEGVKKLTYLTTGLISYTFCMVFLAIQIPTSNVSAVSFSAFQEVFGQGLWIIIASIIAFVCSQLIDAALFVFFKKRTGSKMIWLRSTGSTVISQLFDSFIVTGIAFWLTGKLSFQDYVNMAATGYSFKLLLAVGLTPLIYLGHYLIKNFLERESSVSSS